MGQVSGGLASLSDIQSVAFASYVTALDYNSDSQLVYLGVAMTGSAKAAASWKIAKLTYTSGNLTDIQWAGGVTTFVNVWNNRAAFVYS
jgi:hypothetical protein